MLSWEIMIYYIVIQAEKLPSEALGSSGEQGEIVTVCFGLLKNQVRY